MFSSKEPEYANRLMIRQIGNKWRMWHDSHGQSRGEVAILGQVEDQDGNTWRILLSHSLTGLTVDLGHATPCEAARIVVDWYNDEAKKVAMECHQVSERSLAECRSAIHNAGLPKAIRWLSNSDLHGKIQHWGNRGGPVAEPTQPGMPAHDVTDRRLGTPLIRGFLEIDCAQLGH